jgi:hypothetical protein
MKTVVEDAVVVLVEAVNGEPPRSRSQSGQTLEIHKAGTQSIIGIDGHTGFWDELVEIHWDGSHLKELENVSQVELREASGNLLEALPINRTRPFLEKDGTTVFFLTDAE